MTNYQKEIQAEKGNAILYGNACGKKWHIIVGVSEGYDEGVSVLEARIAASFVDDVMRVK